ncbi:MAG TPA: isochorismatase family cysteine hydrolase [Chloroflexota bacterium]
MAESLAQLVDPARAAVLLVDIQNDYCHPDGLIAQRGGDVSTVQDILGPVQRLIVGARSAGVPLIWVRNWHEKWTDSPAWTARRGGPGAARAGSWGAEFWQVQPAEDEPIVNKQRYSGFCGTRLDAVLHTFRRETLIMAGVATNVCVESTARDGLFLDYHIVFLSDCTATNDGPAAQEATLQNMRLHLGVVATADEVVAAWQRQLVAAAAGA